VGHRWRDNDQGNDYITLLDLNGTLQPDTISVRSLLPGAQFHLRGLALIDDRTGTSRTLSVDPAYRLVHSGDVKIYENLTVLPPAFVVHRARVVPDDGAALDLLGDPAFDPAREAILAEGEALLAEGAQSEAGSVAHIVAYEPEQVQLRVNLDAPGYLVLTDTYYPGWTAEVDGQPAPIYRADLYFRAVPLDAGDHQITLRFQPASARLGLGLSLAAWLALALLFALISSRIGRKTPTDV
jgi:hypothetical protein